MPFSASIDLATRQKLSNLHGYVFACRNWFANYQVWLSKLQRKEGALPWLNIPTGLSQNTRKNFLESSLHCGYASLVGLIVKINHTADGNLAV
jgi:hypothetical protein